MSSPQSLISRFFDEPSAVGEFAEVGAQDLPHAYRSLLAHHDHMTVTLEAWYNSLVDVQVISERRDDDSYGRASLLKLQRSGETVQLGIMQLSLSELSEPVRLEIESRALPLGRILIRHHVMREVELQHLWRVKPGPQLRSYLGVPEGEEVYARTARIVVEGKPAVKLLEIVRK